MESGEHPAEVEEVVKTAGRMLRAAYRHDDSAVSPFAVLLITRNRITHASLPRPCLFVLHPDKDREVLEQVREKAAELAAIAVCLAMPAEVAGRAMAALVVETSSGLRIAEAAEITGDRLGPSRPVLPHLVSVGRLMETHVER